MTIRNQKFAGAHGKESLYDLQIPENWNKKLIIFIHGYMGYKDWGCWNLVQDFFCKNNYGFLKYNVSHNGGTTENPIDFDDSNAFSLNTYTKEVHDFELILMHARRMIKDDFEVYLLGHSRGGGIALLQSKNFWVSKICTWAAISSIESRFPIGEELEVWKANTFRYVHNGRTGQDLPLHINQYYDYIVGKDRLNIQQYCRTSKKPTCLIHGADDTSVFIEEGKQLAKWLNTELHVIENTQHTFGSSQPWTKDTMPDALKKACEITLNFFNHEQQGKTKSVNGVNQNGKIGQFDPGRRT